MSFAERVKNPPQPRRRCSMGHLLDRLDPAERAELQKMLDNRDVWPAEGPDGIQSAIEDEGHGRVGLRSIRHHRLGTCDCDDRP